MGKISIKYPIGSTGTGTGTNVANILTIFDEKNSLYIVFEDGTILVGST